MAAVTDATTAVGADANWFKVSEMGMVSNNPDYFGSQVLVVSNQIRPYESRKANIYCQDNCGHYTFTVPKDIAPGNYLIRAEVLG